MFTADLPENLIALVNKFNEYQSLIVGKYRNATRELAKDDLLDPKWYSDNEKQEALNRLKGLIRISDEFKSDVETYYISYCESVYEITDDCDLQIGDYVKINILNRHLLEAQQFIYQMALTIELYNQVIEYFAYLDSVRKHFVLDGSNIYFERDKDLEEMHRRLLSMADIQSEIGKIGQYDIDTITNRLESLNKETC